MLKMINNTNLIKFASLFIFIFACSLIFNSKVEASACTWNGSVDTNLATNGNWDGCTVPTDGDNLIFPLDGSLLGNTDLTNDLPEGTYITGFEVDWDAYTFVGNGMQMRGDFVFNDDDDNGTLDFELNITPTFDYLNISITDANTTMESWGTISGGTDMYKQGDGTLALWGNSDFTSHFVIQRGRVNVYNNDSLGDASAPIEVQDGATVQFFQDITVGNSFSITGSGLVSPDGPLRNASGNNTLSGTITIGGGYTRLSAASGTEMTLSGKITGGSDLYIADTGTIIMSGNTSNDYTGNTIVEDGTLRLDKTSAIAVPTNLSIYSNATVFLNQSNQITDSVLVTVGGLLDVTNNTITNDFNNLDVDGGRINIGGTSDFGGDLTVNDGIVSFQGSNATISTDQILCTGNSSLQDGSFTLTNTTFTFNANTGSNCAVGSVIQGAADITINGKAVGFGGNNTFTGGVTVNANSRLIISNNNSLGTNAGDTTVADGGVLEMQWGITVADETLNLSGQGNDGSGALTSTYLDNNFNGPIVLYGGNVNISNQVANLLSLNGGISGAISGDLIFTGNTTQLGGNSTFTSSGGGVSVIDGMLKKTADVNAIPDNMNIFTNIYGVFNLNSFNETVGTLNSGLGNIELGSATLTFGDSNDVTYNGGITGGGNIVKVGSSKQIFSQNMAYTGTTTVSAGTLVVNGTMASSGITLNGTGTLGGSGTVPGFIASANAVVAPGNSPGILNVNGDVTFASTNTFQAELNGTTVGSGYDQLNVTGNIALNGMVLDLTLGFTPTVGDVFTIMQATGTITGTFNGAANNSVFDLDGTHFKIQYGTSSIVLTATDEPVTTDLPDPDTGNNNNDNGGNNLAGTGIQTPISALGIFILAIFGSIKGVKSYQKANRPIFR